MASEVKANKLSPSSGTDLTLGDASDTVIVPTGATLNVVDGVGVAGGGTGLTSFTAGDVLYATGTTTLAKLGKGTAEQILSMNSGATAPEWTTAAATAGGTGQTGFTAGDILYANSTTTLTKLAKGTGLQGLQTNSGATAPEWAASPQSVLTAAGDILYASGANTLAKLAKGSDDEVLTLASGVPSWASASGGGGKIGQVVQNVDTTLRSTTSTSFVTTGISVTITPSASDSKILLMMDGVIGYSTGLTGNMQLYKNVAGAGDSSMTIPGSLDGFRAFGESDAATGAGDAIGFCYLDSPATASEIVYTMYWLTTGSTAYIGQQESNTRTCPTMFTAMEVLA